MKSNVLKTIIALVFLVLFNVIFFLVGGTEHVDSVWLSYGFVHAAYLCLLATPLFCKSGKDTFVLSASLYLRGLFYFFTELVIGVVFIVLALDSITWPLIVQGLLLAIFIVLQLMSVLANDATQASMQKQRTESINIRSLAQKVQSRMREMPDDDVRKQVVRCYDALTACPIESYPEAQDAEAALSAAVDNLCAAIEGEENAAIEKAAKRVTFAIQDRNTIIKQCRMR